MNDYTFRQKRENEAHEKNYEAWFASLSPQQQEKLRKAGGVTKSARLSKAFVEKSRRQKKDREDRDEESCDPADRPSASISIDIAAAVDTLADWLAEEHGISLGAATAIANWHNATVEAEAMAYKAFLFQRLIAGFIEPGNLRIRAAGLAFAANLAALNGIGTLREFARKNGVTPAAVSKEKRRWQKDLKLPPSPHGKSEAACQNYSTAQKAKHWRNKKCKIKNPSHQ